MPEILSDFRGMSGKAERIQNGIRCRLYRFFIEWVTNLRLIYNSNEINNEVDVAKLRKMTNRVWHYTVSHRHADVNQHLTR
jgi:hypothetical protein